MGAAAARSRTAGDDEDEGVDLSKPLLLSAYGEWTKKSGYYTLAPGAKPTPLIYDDEQIGQAREGRARPIACSSRGRRSASRRTTGCRTRRFASPTKVTNANPFIDEYAWGSKMLVDFKNSKGQQLQGTLTLPANYQPGKKYPMLVYFYELLSNTHHTLPDAGVRRPAALRRIRERRLSRLPAGHRLRNRQARQLGARLRDERREEGDRAWAIADPKHIGIQGHSWGGYETSYILTQTEHVRRGRDRRAADRTS